MCVCVRVRVCVLVRVRVRVRVRGCVGVYTQALIWWSWATTTLSTSKAARFRLKRFVKTIISLKDQYFS